MPPCFCFIELEVSYFKNFDLDNVVSPIDYSKLDELLTLSNYDKDETIFLTQGFKNGFSIGYQGQQDIRQKSPNLPLTVGTEVDLWNKVMKEVKLKRFAGPFKDIPFDSYIQSPIGFIE